MDRLRSVRFALRMLAGNPGFTAIAALVLALGIGANTAVFSIVNAILFRPLRVERPEQLVGCFSKDTEQPDSYRAFSYPNYADLREENTVFESLTAHNLALVGLTEGGLTRRVFSEIVASNFFSTFGVPLYGGRAFTLEEERPGSSLPVVIVSYAFWQKHGADPDYVGKTLDVNGQRYTVVGIAPNDFTAAMALISVDLWFPLGRHDELVNDFMSSARRSLAERDNHSLVLIGRLKEGVTQEKADSELAVLAERLEQAYPDVNKNQTFVVHKLPRLSVETQPSDDSEFETVAILLSATAGAVLLIACLNLASMMLARGTARRKELAIRLAIGGGRGPILRQLLLEGFLLSLLGGVLGLLLAYWGNSLLVSSILRILPLDLVFHTGPDLRVLGVATLFCVVSTLLFSLAPAWKLTRPDLVFDLKDNVSGDTAGGRLGLSRNLLVVGQVSLSLALLTAAGLFLRGAVNASHADPGFDLSGLLVVEVDPGLVGYDETRSREIFRALDERLTALAGIESTSLSATIPYGMVSQGKRVLPAAKASSSGPDEEQASAAVSARFNVIGADYFRTLRTPLLRGRAFTREEMFSDTAPPVAIVDEALAAALFPAGDALGQRIAFVARDGSKESEEMEVVGIAPNLRDDLFDEDRKHVYAPFGRSFQRDMHFYLSSSLTGDKALRGQLEAVQAEIRKVDGQLPILTLKTMTGHLEESMALWMVRAGAKIFMVFGAVTLVLAVIGVYGLRAYSVAQRTREIGIRMSLGASANQTLFQVLREGLGITAAGTVLGLLLAAGIARLLGSFLYQVDSLDPVIFLTAPSILIAASVLACLVPARRASRIDPLVALKYE